MRSREGEKLPRPCAVCCVPQASERAYVESVNAYAKEYGKGAGTPGRNRLLADRLSLEMSNGAFVPREPAAESSEPCGPRAGEWEICQSRFKKINGAGTPV